MLPFWKSAEFWQSACIVAAALITYFAPTWMVTADVILAVVYAALKLFFNVVPELRARGFLPLG